MILMFYAHFELNVFLVDFEMFWIKQKRFGSGWNNICFTFLAAELLSHCQNIMLSSIHKWCQ